MLFETGVRETATDARHVPRTDRQVCGIEDLGGYEKRQRPVGIEFSRCITSIMFKILDADYHMLLEFAGTLLGFDDYVSK